MLNQKTFRHTIKTLVEGVKESIEFNQFFIKEVDNKYPPNTYIEADFGGIPVTFLISEGSSDMLIWKIETLVVIYGQSGILTRDEVTLSTEHTMKINKHFSV